VALAKPQASGGLAHTFLIILVWFGNTVKS